jgi:hypothetical protein
MDDMPKIFRVRQSSLELARLSGEVAQWQKHRTDEDCDPAGKFRGQYQTQVARIVDEVNRAAAAIDGLIRATADTPGATMSLAAVYQECARHDRRIIWLRRAFDFFREKFDQRDNPGLKSCVRAADEVLWSCYKPFFQATGKSLPPAPLPYIENTYSPAAVREDDSSHLEKSSEIEEGPLKPFFVSLPIPLLQLSPTSVTAPWAHVLIGHEAGHFIQDHAMPDGEYRRVFRERVQEIARNTGGEDYAKAWGRWAPEIFADLYSVLTMGRAAVWTIAQFELARPGKITTRASSYPSALTRTRLLAGFASQAGLPAGDTVEQELGIDPASAADSAEARKDLEIAYAVAALIREPLPGASVGWYQLISPDPAAWKPGSGFDEPGEVLQWAEALTGQRQKQDSKTLTGARRVAAGTAQAWSELVRSDDTTERQLRIQSVESKAFNRMIACSEPGTRAAGAPGVPDDRLSQALLNMNDEELFS